MGPYIYIEFFLKLLSYYFIDLCQILNRSKLEPVKFINLLKSLIYRVLIYRDSSVYSGLTRDPSCRKAHKACASSHNFFLVI